MRRTWSRTFPRRSPQWRLAARDPELRPRRGRPPRCPRRARNMTGRSSSTTTVVARLERYVSLAPLHQPNNLAPIRALLAAVVRSCLRLPASTPPFIAATAPSPTITPFPSGSTPRASGATGSTGSPTNTSPAACARSRPSVAAGRVIVAHLGSGASMCALANGRSIESTMGFTALDGIADGHATGPDRSRSPALPDHRKGHEARRGAGSALSRQRAQGPVRHQQRHARARSEHAIRARHSRSTISSTGSG